MARYTGPRLKVLRRVGTDLDGLTRKTRTARDERGAARGRRRPTVARRTQLPQYGQRLREKQKLRYYYGITERQLQRYVERAARQAGPTGANLLALLERRLDNIVFRLGLAPTIPSARQLVSHGHITVNGRRVTAPGFEISSGDVVAVRERSRTLRAVADSVSNGPALAVPGHLRQSDDRYGGAMVAGPSRDDTPIDLQESLVVESTRGNR
jgi:small subunit ribosomal protein S4